MDYFLFQFGEVSDGAVQIIVIRAVEKGVIGTDKLDVHILGAIPDEVLLQRGVLVPDDDLAHVRRKRYATVGIEAVEALQKRLIADADIVFQRQPVVVVDRQYSETEHHAEVGADHLFPGALIRIAPLRPFQVGDHGGVLLLRQLRVLQQVQRVAVQPRMFFRVDINRFPSRQIRQNRQNCPFACFSP